jgi:hypothetical protein
MVTSGPHQRLHRVEAAIVRHIIADVIEPLIDAGLGADAGGFRNVARPALDRIAAAKPDVERAADVALRSFREAREFFHLGESQRAVRLLRVGCHEPHSFHPSGDHALQALTMCLTRSRLPVQK